MRFPHTLISLLSRLSYFFVFCKCYVLLHNTDNSSSVQYYDCMYYTRSTTANKIQGVKYCRQRDKSKGLYRHFDQSCHHNGVLWSFEELSRRNISPSDILRWSSSLEQVDRYSKYLSNHSFDMKDRNLCNCTDLSSFGKFCEYKFYSGITSFNEAIRKQFAPLEKYSMSTGKINIVSQLHQNRVCYVTWICHSGLMCLDWRYICDGMRGMDLKRSLLDVNFR